ncbi:hypothetical protein Psal071_02551 [Piscirickettsia salmonis]|uniref:Uncharacterized protein n=1 Tax=Piscirickettsia salmonis TaxID=1238 RepID=A0A9Q6LQV7_PISSA|nr:hypothetical protein KW89_2404 [Piscirickettsia salmonis]ERL61058.1 hypothetical protein K661_02617 [Piscirickettsia salmonis LF-89 = ATCC VR-1361]QGN78309.1 hypothetical protein Psal001_02547 [Piscirickettsia salmonis]QGN81890.1 hypothetical protein Psal002_02563 [Piscirickettsia salmonis]QGN83837.1 hypothetical protein Psal003_00868 [Piscirickettsia salmonis]
MSLSRKKLIESLFITPNNKKLAPTKFVEVNKPSNVNKEVAACMANCSGNCQS